MTLKNKAHAYHRAVSTYDTSAIEAMVHPDYIQHNPHVPTGRAAFLALIPRLRTHKSTIENLRILEDGPHVVMHHLWHNATPFGAETMAAFHILRFDEQGLIAEHWNVITPLTSQSFGPRCLGRSP